MEDFLWTARQTARCLSIQRSTVYDWAARGILPHVVLNEGSRRNCIRFRPSEIKAFVEARSKKAKGTGE